MISVCLASFNGEKFILRQINSILMQLSDNDELVISDDNSKDSTIEIIKSLSDSRIKLIVHDEKPKNVLHKYEYATANFYNAIKHCNGDYIFLSDQDDIWLPNKISTFLYYFNFSDIVMSNCSLIDENERIILESKFDFINTHTGILSNIFFNKYQGSCMAFKKDIVPYISPIPNCVPHDMWIGVLGSFYFKVALCYTPTLLYRRHSGTITSQFNEISKSGLFFKLYFRILFLIKLFKQLINNYIKKLTNY